MLTLNVSNRSQVVVEGKYFDPYFDFTLSAFDGETPVRVVEPTIDMPVRRMTMRLSAGASTLLATRTLRLGECDPADAPNTFSLALCTTHLPLRIHVVPRLLGRELAPCEATLRP